MINDGGAERMVRSKKVEWWQIVALVVMFLFVAVVFLFFFFIGNGEQMIDSMNKATVKDGYNILTAVKAEYPDVAVTKYEQTDSTVDIEFKYYETILEKDINYIDFSVQVKSYMEKYLSEQPEDFINTGKRRVTLDFPELTYSNVSPYDDFEFSNTFDYVTYKKLDMTTEEFLKSAGYIKVAKVLVFDANGGKLNFGDNPDFSFIKDIKGLEKLTVGKNSMTNEQRDKLAALCKELGIAFEISEGE